MTPLERSFRHAELDRLRASVTDQRQQLYLKAPPGVRARRSLRLDHGHPEGDRQSISHIVRGGACGRSQIQGTGFFFDNPGRRRWRPNVELACQTLQPGHPAFKHRQDGGQLLQTRRYWKPIQIHWLIMPRLRGWLRRGGQTWRACQSRSLQFFVRHGHFPMPITTTRP
jgi:hypothetical protein